MNLRRILLRRVVKAILAKAKGASFNEFHKQLNESFSNVWEQKMREATQEASVALRQSVASGDFSLADRALILDIYEKKLGGSAMQQALDGRIKALTGPLLQTGAAEMGMAFGLKDQNAANILAKYSLFSIGKDSWDSTSGPINEVLREAIDNGYSREQLIDKLKGNLGDITSRSGTYWNIVADNYATKCREIGRVNAYEDSGIKYVQVRAHIDERTSKICRKLNGKLIPVSHLRAQRDNYLIAASSKNDAAVRSSWKMWGAEESVGNVLPANTGLPPYHWNCRTITVAYLGK